MIWIIIVAASILLAIAASTIGYFYYKFRIATRFEAPRDVVKLYQVGRGPRAPSVSPFPMKLETFLRMTKIPYVNDHSSQMSYKGKTPWMEVNGQVIADSQLCIEYLKQHFNVDPNAHLTNEERAIARGFLKLIEENLYWTMCIEMFGDDLEPVKSVIPYRGFKLWLTVTFLRRVISKETWGHGIGRHSKEDIWDIAVRDMDSISHFLGKKPYFMGDRPSEIDCAVFGMMAQIYWHMPGSKHQNYIKEHLPNIIQYIYRMREQFWSDWDTVTREGNNYTSDHGKIYFSDTVPPLESDHADKSGLPSDPLLHSNQSTSASNSYKTAIYIAAANAPVHAFLEFLLPVLRTIFFPSHWLLSHITIVETMISGERGMNPVAMAIINPRKEIG